MNSSLCGKPSMANIVCKNWFLFHVEIKNQMLMKLLPKRMFWAFQAAPEQLTIPLNKLPLVAQLSHFAWTTSAAAHRTVWWPLWGEKAVHIGVFSRIFVWYHSVFLEWWDSPIFKLFFCCCFNPMKIRLKRYLDVTQLVWLPWFPGNFLLCALICCVTTILRTHS